MGPSCSEVVPIRKYQFKRCIILLYIGRRGDSIIVGVSTECILIRYVDKNTWSLVLT